MSIEDITEDFRRQRVEEINVEPCSHRLAAEKRYGTVWSTDEVSQEFVIEGFLAPYVIARRKSDGVAGSLEFQHSPRFYFNWLPESEA